MSRVTAISTTDSIQVLSSRRAAQRCCWSNFCVLYSRQGKLKEAEGLLSRALVGCQIVRIFPPALSAEWSFVGNAKHLETEKSTNNLFKHVFNFLASDDGHYKKTPISGDEHKCQTTQGKKSSRKAVSLSTAGIIGQIRFYFGRAAPQKNIGSRLGRFEAVWRRAFSLAGTHNRGP